MHYFSFVNFKVSYFINITVPGKESGLFGMPPVPALSSNTSFQSGFTSKNASASPLFQGTSAIFGAKDTTKITSDGDGIFGKNIAVSKSLPFTGSTKGFGTELGSSAFKPQSSNMFALKTPVTPKEEQNIFPAPTSTVQSSFQGTSAIPDLFAGTGQKATSALFGGSKMSQPLQDKEIKGIFSGGSQTTKNIFATPKSSISLFGSKSSTSSNLFGGPAGEASRETQSKNVQSLFTKPDPPQYEKNAAALKSSESKLFSGPEPSIAVPKETGKTSIKERLGIKRTLVRDTEEPSPTLPSISGTESTTPSECGSESSESTIDVSPSSGGTKSLKRLSSKEELMSIKSIICEQVPTIALNERIMSKHFSKFGEVSKMYLNPGKQTAIIHFLDHKSARKAKDKGHLISTKIPPIGEIYYHRKNRNRKSSEVSKGSGRRDVPNKQEDSEDGEDVQEELKSMEAYSSNNPLFQPDPHPGLSARVDVLSGTRKRKGEISQTTEIKKSALNPDLPEVVATATTSQGTRPAFNVAELRIKMQSQAMDDLDRYNILEARDKFMKATRNTHDMQTALKGTCPDICPEKERYSRSGKNQLRLYEKYGGIVHHKAAVKEYSRSAADASIPLSHDLRPAHVLMQTMDHLLCNVIDRIDHIGNCGSMEDWYDAVERTAGRTDINPDSSVPNSESAGDWFEFLWSVTRGIRKDITQQVLTDLSAVELVEKCARFHIMCAERLVEEDNHNFDKKLNDENLTKCIQTLKHMYYDLGLESVRCPNEPEFRSYEVLLNLNDGDTLRRVQNLEPWVRQSSEISFALKVLASLSNNNYVKFFKLIRKSTLLQGCILLRYFHQVRRTALDTMVRAYCAGKSVTQYSLSKVMVILGFENISSCARYCRIHGLENEVESDTLFMDRSTFSYPSETPAMERPITLVEAKRKVRWSEIVNGRRLPSLNPYISYQPHDSFDENGFLKQESYQAEDQTIMNKEERNKSMEEMQKRQEQIRSQEIAASEIVDEMIGQVSSDIINQTASGVMKSIHISNVVVEIVDDFTNEITEDISKKVAMEALAEEKNQEIERRLRKEEMMSAAENVSNDIVDEVSQEMIEQVAHDEMKMYEKNVKIQRNIAMAPSVWEDICESVISAEAVSVAKLAMSEAMAHRENLIEEMRQRRLRKLKRKSFNAWRLYVNKVQKQKNTLANFPSAPSFKSIAEQADLLSWGNQNDENPHSPKSLKTRMEGKKILSNLFKAVELEEEFLDQLVLKKIDLLETVGKYLMQSNPLSTALAWKLIICLPNTSYESTNRAICEMVKHKYSGGNFDKSIDSNLIFCQTKKYESSEDSQKEFTSNQRSISLCVRCVNTQILAEEIALSEKKRKDKLSGTSSILFLHIENDTTNDSSSDEEDADDPLARLGSLLRNIPRNPPVPLLVMTTSRESLKIIVDKLDLDFWVKENFILNYNIIRISISVFNLESLVNIDKSILWLAENSSSSSYPFIAKDPDGGSLSNDGTLLVKPIVHFVQEFLSKNVYSEFYNNLKNRQAKGYTHQYPNVLIGLFNSGIEHLVKIVNNPDLTEVSWPIPEFKGKTLVYGYGETVPNYWNDINYIDKICEVLKNLSIPLFHEGLKKALTKVEQQNEIEKYLSRITRSYCDSTILKAEIRDLLDQSFREFTTLVSSSQKNCASYEPNVNLLPWTDIVVAITKYKISCMCTKDEFSTQPTEMVVCYFDMPFDYPAQWKSNIVSNTNIYSVGDYIKQSISNKEREVFSQRDPNDEKEECSRKDLDKMLSEEKYRSEEFEVALISAAEGRTHTDLNISSSHKDKESNIDGLRDPLFDEFDIAEHVDEPRSSGYYYVPVVSYLSPTLGLLAANSAFTLKHRVEVSPSNSSGRKEQNTASHIKNVEKSPSFDDGFNLNKSYTKDILYSHSKSGVVRCLKESVERDIEESEAFDKKLQDALLIE